MRTWMKYLLMGVCLIGCVILGVWIGKRTIMSPSCPQQAFSSTWDVEMGILICFYEPVTDRYGKAPLRKKREI